MQTALAISFWLDALAAENRSAETISNYRRHTRGLVAAVPDIGAADARLVVRRALAEYRASHAEESVRTIYVCWHSFFGWCVRDGLLDESPMRSMKTPRVGETSRDAYPVVEMRALLASLKASRTVVGLRNLSMVAVLLDCGLRSSELCRLTMDDIAPGGLMVRRSKSGRQRFAPLGAAASVALDRYVGLARPRLTPQGGALFVSANCAAFDRHGLRQVLRRAGARAGVELSAHRLRHTWATAHLRAGTPTEALRALGGWAGYQMVANYTHLMQADLMAVQRAHSPLDRL